MKMYITGLLLIFIVVCIYRLFFLKPRYRRMFRVTKDKSRISISYVVLFDINAVAEIIQKRLLECPETPLYISTYDLKADFDKNQNLEMIKKTLVHFQDQILYKVPFNCMYYKERYEILLELWVKYSRYDNYRKRCVKRLYRMYRMLEISFFEFIDLLFTIF